MKGRHVIPKFFSSSPRTVTRAAFILPPAIFHPLLDTISKFKALGVYHGDINSTNILVSPSKAPDRAVLIDFGWAGVREYGESEEEWTSFCELYNDESGLKAVLKATGVDIWRSCFPSSFANRISPFFLFRVMSSRSADSNVWSFCWNASSLPLACSSVLNGWSDDTRMDDEKHNEDSTHIEFRLWLKNSINSKSL